MRTAYRFLARSNHPVARAVRRCRLALRHFALPAPRAVVVVALWIFLAIRSVWYFFMRVFVCEPLFKAYCRSYGKRLHTGVFVHFVQGAGDIICGDDVTIDGKCSIFFASRFADSPCLEIGSRTGIGHNCAFVVARSIRIGDNCRIASDVWMFDSNGHPSDPASRLRSDPPQESDIRPIVIGNNVWLGSRTTIFPGVTIGDGSIVANGAVVTTNVPAYTVVAGNPARRVSNLQPATEPAPQHEVSAF
jgi:acetyltransferase-like isoleucine patch superfamily enzyme